MASGWTKFEIKVPEIPSGDLTKIIEKIKEFIQVIVGILETLLSIIAAIVDPIASAIKTIINAIKEAIESFLEDLGGYLLFVPIRKRLMTNFLGIGDVTPQFASDWGIFGQAESQLDPENPALNEFLTNMNRYNGGNFGFYRTVYDSLNDEGDVNRPQFTSDSDWVGGLVILMGTDLDIFGFLDDIWRLFGLFHAPGDGMVTIPRPQNLRARAISRVLGGKFSVLLQWNQVQNPFVHLEDLGGAYCYPERFAIIRCKNDVRAFAAQSVVDLVGTRTLSEGTTFNGGDTVVIKEDKLNVTDVSYIDSDIPAAEDDAFYYAIAWKVKLYPDTGDMSDGQGTELDYWYISNVVQVVPFPTLPTATPPNWIRTPSIASLFPPLADLLRKFVLYLENFADKILGVTDLLQQYVDFLKSEIARYEAIINRILDEIAKIKVMFDMPTAGIYMRTFKGKGGNVFFETDLLQSLMPGYENAPPFSRGDEYVTGAILMTGGYKPDVEAFIAGLELFFGGGGGISELVDQLGEQVDTLEDLTFGEDLQPTEETVTVEFDTSMCPLNACCNPPDDPIVPTFKSDFSVK
jgi:hypothetical protein